MTSSLLLDLSRSKEEVIMDNLLLYRRETILLSPIQEENSSFGLLTPRYIEESGGRRTSSARFYDSVLKSTIDCQSISRETGQFLDLKKVIIMTRFKTSASCDL